MSAAEPISGAYEHVLIDGFNVLHAVLLGDDRTVQWWLPMYQARVVKWAENISVGREQLSTVVFDASRDVLIFDRVSSDRVGVVYTPDADAWIVERCALVPTPLVITADRSLGDRARAAGAAVIKPWLLG